MEESAITDKPINIGPYTVKLIEVDVLDIAPTNVRIIGRGEDLEYLFHNIDEIGLLHFPMCTSDGHIFSGGERLLAFKEGKIRGKDKFELYKKDDKLYIPCIVYDCPPEEQIIISISENIYHRDTEKADIAKKILELQETYGYKLVEIAKKLGRTPNWLGRYLTYERFSPLVKEVIGEDKLERTSVRRDLTIDKTVRALERHSENPSKEDMTIAIQVGEKIPIDIGDAYRGEIERTGMLAVHEAKERAEHPEEVASWVIPSVSKMLKGRVLAYLDKKKKYTLSSLFALAFEEFMTRNP